MSKYTIVEVVEGESYPFCGIYESMDAALEHYKGYFRDCFDNEESYIRDIDTMFADWFDKWYDVTKVNESEHVYHFMSEDGRIVQIVEHNDPK